MSYQPLDTIVPDVPAAQPRAEPVVQPEVSVPQPAKAPANGSMFRVGFYSRFFDLSTDEFLAKIALASNPVGTAIEPNASPAQGPGDLYGYVWFNATVEVFLVVTATACNRLIRWRFGSSNYVFNYQFLPLALGLFHGYALLMPLALYVGSRWVLKIARPPPLSAMMSIYSYSAVYWLPLAVANLVVMMIIDFAKNRGLLRNVRIGIVGLVWLASGLSIVQKTRPFYESADSGAQAPAERYRNVVLYAVMMVVHLIFMFAASWFFLAAHYS